MMRMKMKIGDFHSVYLISHMLPHLHKMREAELRRVISELEGKIGKLLTVCKNACCKELRHWRHGSSENQHTVDWYSNSPEEALAKQNRRKEHNEAWLKRNYKNEYVFISIRDNRIISFEECERAFNQLHWDRMYGGDNWAIIAREAGKLEAMMPLFTVADIKAAVVLFDHIVDLEHNNDMFLSSYVTFYFMGFLDRRVYFSPDQFNKAPTFLKNYHKKYAEKVEV